MRSEAHVQLCADVPAGALRPSLARRGMFGLFFSGLQFAFLGAILLAWRHHIEPNYLLIGTYFLCQNVGMLLAPTLATRLIRARGVSRTLSLACVLSCAALLLLAAFSPPAPFWWRMGGLFMLGLSAGMLSTSVFHSLNSAFELHPAPTTNLAGTLFCLGCLVCALFLAGTFFVYTVPSLLVLMAVGPAMAAVAYARSDIKGDPLPEQSTWGEAASEFRSPSAILLALLLFFQFGNEGALAGWLALFLTHRLGASPADSLLILALFWFALLVGRLVAQAVLPRVSHAKLLMGAVLVPMFGCLMLLATNNLFGAGMGVLMAGGGFSVILPLVMEKIGDRFPYFNPAFFNGIFLVALTGGLLAPASLGYFAHYFGIGIVMGLPLAGSIMVFLLVLVIVLEAKLSGKIAPAR